MDFSIKIDEVLRNDDQTVVNFTLRNGKTKVKRSLGFPKNITAEEVREELKEYLDVYNDEEGKKDKQKAIEAEALKKSKETDTLKKELEGEEIVKEEPAKK